MRGLGPWQTHLRFSPWIGDGTTESRTLGGMTRNPLCSLSRYLLQLNCRLAVTCPRQSPSSCNTVFLLRSPKGTDPSIQLVRCQNPLAGVFRGLRLKKRSVTSSCECRKALSASSSIQGGCFCTFRTSSMLLKMGPRVPLFSARPLAHLVARGARKGAP